MECDYCSIPSDDLRYQDCQSNYCEEEKNIDPLLCNECAIQYKDYWVEQWLQYEGSITPGGKWYGGS